MRSGSPGDHVPFDGTVCTVGAASVPGLRPDVRGGCVDRAECAVRSAYPGGNPTPGNSLRCSPRLILVLHAELTVDRDQSTACRSGTDGARRLQRPGSTAQVGPEPSPPNGGFHHAPKASFGLDAYAVKSALEGHQTEKTSLAYGRADGGAVPPGELRPVGSRTATAYRLLMSEEMGERFTRRL